MLSDSRKLTGLTIHATDGEIGRVDDLYFDDERWAIRYLVVKTGGWLDEREVLISPISALEVDFDAKEVDVSLTREQVRKSPPIATHKPVSRQNELEFMGYYGYPYYWEGPMTWGPAFFPAGLAIPALSDEVPSVSAPPVEPGDSHLRSMNEVKGYEIAAADGEIGHVDGFIVDDITWAIRYIEVATRNWWPGKKVLISPEWIQDVDWPASQLKVRLTRETISGAPEYSGNGPITREFETRLHRHYGSWPYWLNEGGDHGQRRAL